MPSKTSSQPPGLYNKFDIRRTDGRDLPGGDRVDAEYLVLDLTHDEHSRTAALAYASAIHRDYPIASADLRLHVLLLEQQALDRSPIPKTVDRLATVRVPPYKQAAGEAYRQFPTGGQHAVVAVRFVGDKVEVVTIAEGKSVGSKISAGGILAMLLKYAGREPWWVVGIRTGDAAKPPKRSETLGADSILAAARLVDMPIAGVVQIVGPRVHLLAESDPAWFTPGPAGNPVALPAVGGLIDPNDLAPGGNDR